MSNAQNGARIKAWAGSGVGSGIVKNITFEGFVESNVDNPVVIDQCYMTSDFLDLVTMVEELLDLDYEVRRVPPPPSPALLPARSLSTERLGHPALLLSASGECSSSMAAFPLSSSTSGLVPSSGIGSDPGPSSRTSLAAFGPPMSGAISAAPSVP